MPRNRILKVCVITAAMMFIVSAVNGCASTFVGLFAAQLGHDLPASRSSGYAAAEAAIGGFQIGIVAGAIGGALLGIASACWQHKSAKMTLVWTAVGLVIMVPTGAIVGAMYANLNDASHVIDKPINVYVPTGLIGGLVTGTIFGMAKPKITTILRR